jgi:hypothetical protein
LREFAQPWIPRETLWFRTHVVIGVDHSTVASLAQWLMMFTGR